MPERAYAEIVVDLPLSRVDQVYHYAVPERFRTELCLGSRVLVPFGRRQLAGYVVGFRSQAAVEQVKDILDVLSSQPAFTHELYTLARWMAERYLCTTAQALQCIAAPSRGAGPRYEEGVYAAPGGGSADQERLTPKQRQVWRTVREHPGLTRAQVAALSGVTPVVVARLLEKGVLTTSRRSVARNPYPVSQTITELPRLTGEQLRALEAIEKGFQAQRKEFFLLHGVTGSGKTEIYLRAAAGALVQGRQVLVLVPEITLATQLIHQFKARFGDLVAVLHSRLGAGERYDEWNRIFRGEAPIVVGARSAVFAPLQNIGLFVLDEEHEPGYKQEEAPRYLTGDVVRARAALSKAVVVFGSATPALRTYARALTGQQHQLLKLTSRVDGRSLPQVRVVDLREELQAGNRHVFSRYLAGRIREKLDQGQQVLLFLNRRGLATIVLCRACGEALSCAHCAISLTYHRDGSLHCHYCGYRRNLPAACPVCGGERLSRFGTGTQRVEEETQRLFPGARVVRLDGDTVTGKRSHDRLLDSFREGQADILIGTQMIAKGLDLPGVTLVGVVNADTTLLLPDYQSAERTFQLVTQVAGRAGRGPVPGEVVVQTYHPDHYSIQAATSQNYELFFIREMALRREMGYPPFTTLARVLFRGRRESQVEQAAQQFRELLALPEDGRIQVMGPAPPPVARIKDYYRRHLILKAPKRKELRMLLVETLDKFEAGGRNKVLVGIDIDPQSLF
ncbi:replication restart helicase PriA [Candidatus Desulforudis audaxviator]|uniref:Replication restart protein PriA n=1 Tax=Desulforudis audaxviator (strain MP104C) TaxID=477974 RepID=B1I505_DESAP|nr:primosomal protein N' [Candidatus Desulforudis audaxviator]ACA60096.1 primosomal protein N' [Candidatus Desulforudis audaxviator MP104C]AZK60132.1 Helicase PriA essential for oriC/DnaA-independent DNA replication [Candidatus Desulforudis audaxviator]